jgi:hypothetical protein
MLWIDAIYINQEDVEEKKEQVQLMQSIYRLAATVIGSLGEATHDSDLAFSRLGSLEENDVNTMAEAGFQCSKWVALNTLWSLPFWSRIWIVQELALGTGRVVMQCGTRRASVGWRLLR